MARRRRNVGTYDAEQILRELIRDRRISTAEINRYREIRQLEQRLEALRGGGGRRRSMLAPQRGRAGRRSSRITAEQRASRQLQGRYLGLIRQIPASQRPRYAKIAKDRGREAAIREMQSALK